MSLAKKFVLWVVLVATLISGSFGAFNYYSEKRRLLDQLERSADRASARLLNVLPQALYDFAIAQAKKALEAEMANPDFAALAITDKDNKVVAVKTRDSSWTPVDSSELPGEPANISKAIAYGEGSAAEQLGTLFVYLDDRFVNEQIRRTLGTSILHAVILDILFIVLVGILVRLLVSRPVRSISSMISAIAGGDLTQEVPEELLQKKDEIGEISRALNVLNKNLKNEVLHAFQCLADGNLTFQATGVIREPLEKTNSRLNETMKLIRSVTGSVTQRATEISEASQSLSDGAATQASSLEEITAAMSDLGNQTQTNAASAAQANHLSQRAREAAENGAGSIRQMVAAMDDIRASSTEIAKILKTIDDIAFQTNLLALNAAVEAARAGRHGRGFSVVAEEVRNLAGRSTKAAHETSAIIELSNEKIERGRQTAEKSARSFQEIAAGTVEVTDLIGNIAQSSTDQATGIGEIRRGLEQIDQVTQKNSAHAHNTATAAVELAEEATQLNDMLQQFKLR